MTLHFIPFYPYSIEINKWSGICKNINDPHAKLCVPNVIKTINANVFSLFSKNNETKHTGWDQTRKCNVD